MTDNRVSTYSPYNLNYIEQCKAFWYANGRPSSDYKIKRMLEENNIKDENGRTPSVPLINNWRKDYGWDAWADLMDARVNEELESDLVANKAKMLREQAQRGFELQDLGMNYLKSSEGGFDSSSAAVQAVIRGAELERTSRGIGEMILKMAKMSDSDLKDEIIKRLQRATAAGAIDVEEIPQENTDDTESSSSPEG